jgi:hypothetical protein
VLTVEEDRGGYVFVVKFSSSFNLITKGISVFCQLKTGISNYL